MLPESQINGKAVASDGKAWCLACHDNANSWYTSAYPPPSAPQRDAAGYPVAGTWLGAATYNDVTNAHRLIPETTRTAGSGQDVRRDQGDCLYCHAAHRGANAYDGLKATFRPTTAATLASDQTQGTYASMCFTCHGGFKPSGFATAPVDIKRSVTGDAPGAGHRVKTAGGLLPVGSPLPCYECHNPHGSTRGNKSMISDVRGASLTTTDGPVGVRQFCFTCHTTSDTGKGWNSATATYTVPASGDTVVGLDRNGPVLMLKANINAHAQAKTSSCYDCHGSDYGTAAGNNVHNPGPGGGGTSHAFTAGSDSVAPGDAGCTNSGSGCHGTDATRASFAVYHPESGCTSGVCHTSPSMGDHASNGDCQSCHDATFVGAPVRADLATQHYNETTHTASGLSATVSAGGSASATCVTCHDPNPAADPRVLPPSTRTSRRFRVRRTAPRSPASSATRTRAPAATPRCSRTGRATPALTATGSAARHRSTERPLRSSMRRRRSRAVRAVPAAIPPTTSTPFTRTPPAAARSMVVTTRACRLPNQRRRRAEPAAPATRSMLMTQWPTSRSTQRSASLATPLART